jgi:hypothetical protein
MAAHVRTIFDRAQTIEERTVIRKKHNRWHVRAHSVSFVVSWDGDVVTMTRRRKSATATMNETSRTMLLSRIEHGFIESAFQLFVEVQQELADLPDSEIQDDDDGSARASSRPVGCI